VAKGAGKPVLAPSARKASATAMNIFTHVASSQQNCYIESYHSKVESAVCARYEFENLEEAKEVFNRFINFYNQGRIHGA